MAKKSETTTFKIRLPEEDLAAWKEAAEEEQLPVAAWLRRVARAAIAKAKKK